MAILNTEINIDNLVIQGVFLHVGQEKGDVSIMSQCGSLRFFGERASKFKELADLFQSAAVELAAQEKAYNARKKEVTSV